MRFVLAETNPNNAIKGLVVLGSGGHTIARRNYPHPQSPLQQSSALRASLQQVGPMHTVATLYTIGTHRLLVEKTGRGRHGTICSELVTPSGTSRGCGPPVDATSLKGIGPTQIGRAAHGWFLFNGPVGSAIRSLQLQFGDGTAAAIPIHHGYILYQLSPQNLRSGHRPVKLVARGDTGQVVRVRKFYFLR
jgi:hypothetical protein